MRSTALGSRQSAPVLHWLEMDMTRTDDLAQLIGGLLFLHVAGAGAYSIDAWRRLKARRG